MITLTLRHNNNALKPQIDRLYESFRTLRRDKKWTADVQGGLAVLELKLSKAGKWHPHLHCITVGSWIDQRWLAQRWLEITGDSSIVDVRIIDSKESAARYVTKYLTKPADQSIINDPEALDEAVVSLKGRRMVLPWGTARKLIAAAEAAEDETDLEGLPDWITLCPLERVIVEAAAGDPASIAILAELRPP